MAHWSDPYLDIPHHKVDCGELVELVLREVFARDVRFPRKENNNLRHRAGLITKHAADFARPIAQPVDGCGVMIISRGCLAHIGLYCLIDRPYVLHSDSLFGSSVREPLSRLLTRFKVEGFYEWLD